MVQMLVCSVMEMSHSQLQHHNNIEHDDGMAFRSADLGLLLLLCLAALSILQNIVIWTKVRRSKAGKVYDDHEAVHIVA